MFGEPPWEVSTGSSALVREPIAAKQDSQKKETQLKR